MKQGRHVTTDPRTSRSLHSDRPAHESVATKRPTQPLSRSLRSDRSATSRSLRSDRPSLSVDDPLTSCLSNLLGGGGLLEEAPPPPESAPLHPQRHPTSGATPDPSGIEKAARIQARSNEGQFERPPLRAPIKPRSPSVMSDLPE